MPTATARKPANRAPVKVSVAAKAMRGATAKTRGGVTDEDMNGYVADSDAIILPETEKDLTAIVEGDLSAIRATGDFERIVVDEAFMHQLVAITVSPGDEQSNPYAQTEVNNKMFNIPRGRPVRVPRYVVEALAHAKQANYKTSRTLPGDPRHMVPIESHVFSYPFVVKHDPAGVKGQKWLDKVLNDPA